MPDEIKKDDPPPTADPPAPPPAYVLKEDFDNLTGTINRLQDNFNAVTAQLLQSRTAAPSSPDSPRAPTQEEIDAALRDGDTAKLISLLDARQASRDEKNRKDFDEQIRQIREVGTQAISSVVERTAVGSLKHYPRFKKEIDAEVAKIPATVRMNPEVYQITHDAVVGRNIDLILKEEREKILRENNLNPQTIPGSGGRLVPGSDNDIPTFENYFGAEAMSSLVGVGRTVEHECRRHGFKDWPSYYKSLKEEEAKNGPQ